MAAPPTKIFVGRLPLDAKQEDLRVLFEKYGAVTECDVLNRFGFVHMKTEEMAKRAIAALHNSEFMGSRITVEPSTGKKGGGPGGRGGRAPGAGRGGGPMGRNGAFGGARPSPYDRPRGMADRYGPPGGAPPMNGVGYYDEYEMYRRGPAPLPRDPYGPPAYERRYEPPYGERYLGADRDRRGPMPPVGGSPYDRRVPPAGAEYPAARPGPDYRRRTPPPGPMGDAYYYQ